MIRLLEYFREGFAELGRDPRLAAPAAALVALSWLGGFVPGLGPLVGSRPGFAALEAAAAAAYAVLVEPGLRSRAAALFVLFFVPWLLLALTAAPVARFVTAHAFQSSVSHLWINGWAAYQHLSVMAVGLLACVAAKSFDALEQGAGAAGAWREGWEHVLDRFSTFGLMAVLFWIGQYVFGTVVWPLGPFLAALLLHAGLIGGGRKL